MLTHHKSKTSQVKAGAMALFVAALTVGLTTPVAANQDTLASLFGQKQSKALSVHQAFKVDVAQKDDALVATFVITPEHYMYKDKLTAVLPDGVSSGQWQFNAKPSTVDDPQFGKVAVFESDVVATLPLTNQGTEPKDVPVTIKWQGCAKAGLCYPPETIQTTIHLPANKTDDKPAAPKSPATPAPIKTNLPAAVQANAPTSRETVGAPVLTPAAPVSDLDDVKVVKNDKPAEPSPVSADVMTDVAQASASELVFAPSSAVVAAIQAAEQSAADVSVPSVPTINHTLTNDDNDPFGINKRPILALFLLFLAGLLLSFTPCVYPMIPIVANIVARQNTVSPAKGFVLSASYGVGVASAYGLLGALVAWFGQAVGVVGWLQNPYVLGAFALIFALLALAMFGVINMALPSAISGTLQSTSQAADNKLGSIGGSFLVGSLSALVVSPCVSLPMAGALTAVSVSGSALFGFLALFMLGLGLSLPLMVIGAIQGKFMPKAGAWMNAVKEFCGLLLLAVSLSLLERILLSPVMLGIWALWFALMAIWLWQLAKLPSKALALLSAIWSGCLMVGMATGQTSATQPLAKFATQQATLAQNNADIKVHTLAQLDDILARHDKVLVDVVADWCIECRIIEHELLTNRPALLAEYQVVKLDITDTTDDSRAALARYHLVGPPALLLYKQGQLVDVLLGKVDRADFEQALLKHQ